MLHPVEVLLRLITDLLHHSTEEVHRLQTIIEAHSPHHPEAILLPHSVPQAGVLEVVAEEFPDQQEVQEEGINSLFFLLFYLSPRLIDSINFFRHRSCLLMFIALPKGKMTFSLRRGSITIFWIDAITKVNAAEGR